MRSIKFGFFLLLSCFTICVHAQWVNRTAGNTNYVAIDFYDTQNGLMLDEAGNLFTTKNGGENWMNKTMRLSGCCNNDVKLITKNKIAIAAGLSFSSVAVPLCSKNGGDTWFENNVYFSSLSLFSIDSARTHIVGFGGTYYWLNMNNVPEYSAKNNLNTSQDMYGVHFPDTATGYTCGNAGTIRKTVTGGKSWTAQSSGSSSSLRSVFFINKTTGWIVGSEQTVLLTTNGGITWKRTSYLGGGTTYRSVKFVSPKKGYLCGDFGTIMKTTDGGNTWKPMQTGTYETLNQLAFPDSLNGWAVGTNGTILHLNEDKTIPKVQTVVPSDTFMCTTGTYSVAFAVSKRFNAGNVFTAQLSDGQGNWASPQTLGTLVSDTSGSIAFSLNQNQMLDGGYRIRILSSNPAFTSVQTQSPLSIDAGTVASVSIGTTLDIKCEGAPIALRGIYTNGGFDPIFQWLVNGIPSTYTGLDFSSILQHGDKVSFQMTSSAECPVPKRPIVTIDAPVTAKPAKPSISQTDLVLESSADFGNQWMKNGMDIALATAKQYEVQATGTYTVRTSSGPCVSDVSDPVQVLVTGVVSNLVESEKASLYPVPCTDLLHYKTDYSVQTVFLKDLAGRTIWQEQANAQKTGMLELSQTNTGMYFLELLDTEGKLHRMAFCKQ